MTKGRRWTNIKKLSFPQKNVDERNGLFSDIIQAKTWGWKQIETGQNEHKLPFCMLQLGTVLWGMNSTIYIDSFGGFQACNFSFS